MTPETEHLMKALWLVVRVCVIVVAVVWANGGFTLAYGSSDATIIPVVWPLF